jgi:hypothetical protein
LQLHDWIIYRLEKDRFWIIANYKILINTIFEKLNRKI